MLCVWYISQAHEQSNLTSPYVWICTPKHTWRYKIFSVHTASVTGETYTLFSMADEQFAEYLKSMKSASELQLDAEADKDDKVITMSTCTGNSSTRFVIQAKRLEERRKLKWIKKLKHCRN